MHDERGVFDLFDALLRLGLWISDNLILSDLIGQLLNLFVSSFTCLTVELRPTRLFILKLGWNLRFNPIVGPQNVLQVIHRVKDMNTDSPIETSWFE